MTCIFRRQLPSSLEVLMAIGKMIVMDAQADPEPRRRRTTPTTNTIDSISGPNGMASKADWSGENTTLGRVFESVPECNHGLHNSVSIITDSAVPAYLLFLVNGTDAETSYAGSLDFKVVVEKNQAASTDIKPWPFEVESG